MSGARPPLAGRPAGNGPAAQGVVHFVGAGPGDPELLTLKARRLIAEADVVIYAGSLVNPAVLVHSRPDASRWDSAGMKLEEQIDLMTRAASLGQGVVRLQSGDPSLYGAIAEQMAELRCRGIPYDIVPGVSSANAAAAALGIEYTLPGGTQTVILGRLGGRTPVPSSEAMRDLAAHRCSLVVFLSAGMIDRVVDELRAAGYGEDTPVAIVSRASWPDEQVLRGTLADIGAKAAAAEVTHQALIVVSPALSWPAEGQTPPRSHLYGTAMVPPPREDSFGIVALTRRGTETGSLLHARLPNSVLYAPMRFLVEPQREDTGVRGFAVAVRQVLQEAFARHRGLVCIMAAGIVVRELAPLLQSKHWDPGVVVLDECGQHAVSLVGGHRGGANDLARLVATLLGGEAVITTASDIQQLPTLEVLGAEWGWRLENPSALTATIAALVNAEPVGVYQNVGDESWLMTTSAAPVTRYPSWQALAVAKPRAAIVVSDRVCPEGALEAVPNTVIYRPPCLALGVGCNKGTVAEEILEAVTCVLSQAGYAEASIAAIGTIDVKAAEPGLLEACRRRKWPMHVFSREEIESVSSSVPNPSPHAERAFGVKGVAEPCALLVASSTTLVVQKQKHGNVTVAVARLASSEAGSAG